MKKLLLTIALVLLCGITMAQSSFVLTETKLTSSELNSATTPTYIAIKNLSATNHFFFVGNTGGTPYSKEQFSNDAVFIWEPVEGQAGSFRLKKLNGTYMQASSPKDFGTVDNAAVFTTTNPTSQGSGSTKFNGDGDSQAYINGSDDANLVRFVKGNNWINVQNGNTGTPTYNTGLGGWTIHYVYQVAEVSAVSVTYQYYIGDVKMHEVTKDEAVGAAFNAPAFDYLTINYPEGNVTAETTTVRLDCEQNLPFTTSTSFDNATWYYMTIRSNNQKYVSRSENTPYANNAAINISDDGLWAFKGNVFEGIQLINKGAGDGYTLGYDATSTGSNIYMKEGNTSWTIEEGNGGFTLRQEANEYAHDYSSNLQFWNNGSAANDPGSAFIACEAAPIQEAYIEDWKEVNTSVFGYVGSYAENLRETIEGVTTVAQILEFEANNTRLAVNTNDCYRLVCVHPKAGNNGDANYKTLAFNGESNLVTTPASKSNVNQIFKFEDAGNGKFYLKNLNADGYLNKIAAGNYRSAIVTKNDACKLDLTHYGNAQWKLHNSESNDSRHCLFAENHPTETIPYACAGWENGANSASAWYIVPATDIEITINGYASVYLPFAVETANATAYAVTAIENGYVTLTEMADIAANEGAILAGNGTATLNIVNAAKTDWSANKLEGTTIDTNIENEAFVLGKVKEEIGLYKALMTEGSWKNNANKAYLPMNTTQSAASYSFTFGEGTTGVNEVKGEPTVDASQNGEVKTIYDLTGRKVEAITAPGIYIIGGKKVLVK